MKSSTKTSMKANGPLSRLWVAGRHVVGARAGCWTLYWPRGRFREDLGACAGMERSLGVGDADWVAGGSGVDGTPGRSLCGGVGTRTHVSSVARSGKDARSGWVTSGEGTAGDSAGRSPWGHLT